MKEGRTFLALQRSPMSNELIPNEHVEKVCKPGCGEETCRYLASRQLPDYFCAKGDKDLLKFIELRVAQGTLGSKGDNCSGPPDYKVK
jgi:hypothetical protein